MSDPSSIRFPLKLTLLILMSFYLGACTNSPGVGLQETDLTGQDHINLLFYDDPNPQISMNTKTETNSWQPLHDVEGGFSFVIQNRDSTDFPNCVHLQWQTNNMVTSIQLLKGLDTNVLNSNNTKAFSQESQNAYMTHDNFFVVFDADVGHRELGLKDETAPPPIEIQGSLSGIQIVRANTASNYWKEDLMDAINFGPQGNTKTMICAEHGEDLKFYILDHPLPPKLHAAQPGGGSGGGSTNTASEVDNDAAPVDQGEAEITGGGSTLPGGPSSGGGGVVATSSDSGDGGSSGCPLSLTEATAPKGDMPVWLAGFLIPGLLYLQRRRAPAKRR